MTDKPKRTLVKAVRDRIRLVEHRLHQLDAEMRELGKIVYDATIEAEEAAIDRELECPCCGDVGATADADGLFADGQELECGCSGQVSLDTENPPSITISDVFDPDVDCDECAGRNEGV